MCFSKSLWFFLNFAKGSKIALQCDWTNKNLQNVQKVCVLKKDVFFLTNPLFLKKTAKDNKFAVQCDWMSKISHDVRNLGSSWRKNRSVSRKKIIFLKSSEISKFAVKCDWKIQLSQSIQNLFFFNWNISVFRKKLLFFF